MLQKHILDAKKIGFCYKLFCCYVSKFKLPLDVEVAAGVLLLFCILFEIKELLIFEFTVWTKCKMSFFTTKAIIDITTTPNRMNVFMFGIRAVLAVQADLIR